MSNTVTIRGSDRFYFILKTQIFVTIGYLSVTIETYIAKMIGLTSISPLDVAIISSIVIIGSMLFILVRFLKKSVSVTLEKIFFVIQVVLYVILFTAWTHRLGDLRLFALFCSLFAILIVLLYTNFAQSLMMSISTIISFIAVSYYNADSIYSSSFKQEMFYGLCFIPTIIFISVISNQITKKNKELEQSKKDLEKINTKLVFLNHELEENQKMTKIELDIAQDIQKSLLPEQPQRTSKWDIALFFKPRYGVSGDFYDFYYEEGILKGLSLFDVSGHGVASALITILAKPIFNNYFNRLKNEPLGRLLEIANYSLRKDLNEINMYITGMILRLKNDDIEYVNAGHPDPIYKIKNSGKVSNLTELFSYGKNSPIGLFESISASASLKFTPASGDVLLLFTDCLTESKNFKKSPYGYNRLIRSLEEAPDGTAREILDHLLGKFYSFLNEKEIEDDFTALLLKKL